MNAITLYARNRSATFEAKVQASLALLQQAGQEFSPSPASSSTPLITQASSLGAEDMVVTDLIVKSGINCNIFVLETGMLHAETVALIDRTRSHYQRPVDVYRPDPATANAFVAEFGLDAMYKSLGLRKQCCDFRKMAPLAQALAGKRAWITGLRREQSQARAEVHATEAQTLVENGVEIIRTKVNPLADWTWGDVWHYIQLHGVPYNPLHDQFFPSIGCAPCTRAVTLGEDFRSGRWWWEQESVKECGLHLAQDGSHEAEEPAAFEPLAAVSSLANRPGGRLS